MYHHDDRPLHIAIDDTATRFQAELNAKIAASQHTALSVIERIQREVPDDRIASSQELHFISNGTVLRVGARGSAFEQPLHRHALSQVADRAGIPDLFVTRLLAKPWGTELLADNLNRILGQQDARRLLLRSVRGEVRGILSDQYRRLDSRPIIEAFAFACADVGAVAIEGVGGDLRYCVRAIVPVVYRPCGEEVIAFGIEISSSDVGASALSVRCFCLRVWCCNYARLDEELRKVHLGKRLDDSIEFSRETYELDSRAMASAVRDIVRTSLAPGKIKQQVALIERAMTEKIDFRAALSGLPKLGLLKKEIEAVNDVLTTGGITELPTGNSIYRMSNAISWIAKSAETPERRLDLEQLAGSMLLGNKSWRDQKAA